MNRIVPISIFSPSMFHPENLLLNSLDFNVNGVYFYRQFYTPLAISKDEELIIRINHDGAMLEFSKREVIK